MQTILQRFIRGDVISTEMVEIDALGRQIGSIVVVNAPVSPELRVALDANDLVTTTAQDDVIATAISAKQSDPYAVVELVADLIPAISVIEVANDK